MRFGSLRVSNATYFALDVGCRCFTTSASEIPTQGTTIAIVTHDRRVAQSTQRVVRMRDGRIVADHRLLDPMEEDLRTLANSRLGQAILDPEDEPLEQITPEEELVLRRILERIDGPMQAPAVEMSEE